MTFIKKFGNKYRSFPLPVKASFWFAVCSFLQKGISMITMPIFTRLLTTEEYGVYTVYQSWFSLISIFATLNLSAGVFYNGMIKYDNDRDGFTSSMQTLSTVSTLLLFFVFIIGHEHISELFKLSDFLICIMMLELVFVSPFYLWSARKRFDYSYKPLILITTIIAVFSPIIGVIAVLNSSSKANARILSYAGVQIAVGICLYIYNIKKGKRMICLKYWKYALWFNIPLIPHYLSMTVLGQADRIMIGNMVGSSEAAIYGVAYNISQLMILVTTAISNSFNPYTYKSIKEGKYKEIGDNAIILLIVVGSAVVLLSCFGPEIIRIFAAPEYYEARWIIPPVALSVYYIFLYPLFSNVEFYYEANKFVMIASTLGAISNIILNYIFIKIYGYVAAGYTTLFCYMLFVVAHYYFHKRVLKKKANGIEIYNIKQIFLLSLVFSVVVIGITLVYDTIILRYLVIVAIIALAIIKRKHIVNSINGIRK